MSHYTDEALQHREDTKHVQWQDGMYVMLEDLQDPRDLQDYALAVVEDSLRRSVFNTGKNLFDLWDDNNRIGVFNKKSGYWGQLSTTKLTRAQSLYIATGSTTL
jgi:hypothetical protein